MKVYLSTAERSGKVYARLLRTELESWPGVKVMGGFADQDLAPVGFAAGLRTSETAMGRIRAVEREVQEVKPDIFMAVAWSEPHIVLGLRLRKMKGMRRFFYAPPQLWAWGGWRAGLVRRGYHALFCLYPREAELLRTMRLPARFAGNPLAGLLRPYLDGKRRSSPPTVALLPGSRASEKSRHVGILARFSREWKKRNPGHRMVWLYPTEAEARQAARLTDRDDCCAGGDSRYSKIAGADLAIVTSGTASLETALLGTPQVVFYTLSPLETTLARAFTRVQRFALPNLITGQDAVTELLNPESGDLLRCGKMIVQKQRESMALARIIHEELTPLDNSSSFLSML